MDGRDLTPALKGKKLDQVPLNWHFPHYRGSDIVPYSIIRDGDWKLIKRYEGDTYELFNRKDDPAETTDLSGTNPDKVYELEAKLQQWLKQTGARMPERK